MSSSFHYPDFPRTWSGPSPPTPVVVNMPPGHEYFGGRPTPPPSPPNNPVVDEHAPCPPTPYCVLPQWWSDAPNPGPSQSEDQSASAQEPPPDESALITSDDSNLVIVAPKPTRRYVSEHDLQWLHTPDAGTSQSMPSKDRSTPEQENAVFVDPLVASPDPYGVAPHPSDFLIYDRVNYAYPSPILAMMERARLDKASLHTQLVDPWACGLAYKQFSITGGKIPLTEDKKTNDQTLDYYVTLPWPPPRNFSYSYPHTIQTIQREIPVQWASVFPKPIPPVIIRLHDLIAPYTLKPRTDGFAFVVPTDDSIWGTVCQRGVDSTFRPINPSATVMTDVKAGKKEVRTYQPQHIVASEFAVNLFVEWPDCPGGLGPYCEYLGAYVLQVVDGVTMSRVEWANVKPEVQQSVFNQVPHYFEGTKHPSRGWPRLPCVKFYYYMWDSCMVRLVDRYHTTYVLQRCWNSLNL